MSNSLARPPFTRVPFDPDHRRKWLSIPFAEAEYETRWNRVGRALEVAGLDVLVAYAITETGARVLSKATERWW
jgi:hypothetical protein